MTKRATKSQFLKRQELVTSTLINCLSLSESMSYLKNKGFDVSFKTYYRDVESVKKNNSKIIEGQNANEVLGLIRQQQNERMKHLWLIARNPENTPNSRVNALGNLREEMKETVKQMQLLGFIPKDAPSVIVDTKVQVLNVMDDIIRELKEDGTWEPSKPFLRA